MMGRSLWLEDELENSVPRLERAITLCPNYAQAIYSRAFTHLLMSENELGHEKRLTRRFAAVRSIPCAMPCCPAPASIRRYSAARPKEPILVDRAAREPRVHVMIGAMAAICHVWAGNKPAARYWAEDIRLRDPKLTTEVFLTSFPFRDGPVRTRVTEALSTLGF